VIDEDVYVGDFLEHFGKKGMRWGSRRARRHGDAKLGRRTTNKLAVGIGGVAGLLVARQVGGLLEAKFKVPISQPLLSGAGVIAGVALTRKALNKNGDTPISSLPKAK
jgi:hypothetical protein